MESQGKAIPFITYDPATSEFVLNDDAYEFLKSIHHPVGVISVAGMYRTGKSYLLNRMLLNKQSGFGVGPSVNPCTKGLWIWNECIPGFSSDGEPISVLVIDSEGIGALNEDQTHDTKIFSLAILLSSYFIYNSVGSIDENAIQALSLVINLTKHIHLKANGSHEDIDPEEYSNYFPTFMWVVRDFTLQLVDEEGEAMTSKDYLEKALQPQKGFSDNIEQKNRIRRLLKSFFKDIDCCTIVRPLTKEEDLQNLDKMEFDKLRSEFVEQVMQLRRKVINRIKAKSLNSKAITGEMLCNLAQNYITAFNKGVVPNIENAWTYICKNECLKALHEGLEKYDVSLKDMIYGKLPLDELDLQSQHKEAKEAAISEFQSKSVGNLSSDYMKDLILKIRQKYNTVKVENEKEAKKACQAFLNQSYVGIEKKLRSNEFPSFSDYEKEMKAFQHYFSENGPTRS